MTSQEAVRISPPRPSAERFLPAVFLACVFLLAFSRITDPDAWLHLSIGREILRLGGLPSTEPFVYPRAGQPFLYTSWLFALAYYLGYLLLGAMGVILLKAATVTATFGVMLRDAARPRANVAVAVTVLAAAAALARHRFTERPDTLLMLMLCFFIYSLNAYRDEGRKLIYLLPLVGWVWGNTHSSVNLMLVPPAAFVAGGLLQSLLGKRGLGSPRAPSPGEYGIVGLASCLAVLLSFLNPNGLGQWTFGYRFMSTPWYKQEIMELNPPSGRLAVLVWVILCLLVLSCLANRRSFAWSGLLLNLPLAWLSLTSIRFIFIFAVTAGPVMARNISEAADLAAPARRLTRRPAFMAVMAAVLLALTGMAIFGPPALRVKGRHFGPGFDESAMPRGAVDYLDRAGVSGRVLNQFEWGQYVVWRGYPRRTVIIDGRGDIPEPVLERLSVFRTDTPALDELRQAYGFESILVNYPPPGRDLLGYGADVSLVHPGWALVYWDDVSLLYLRRGGPYDAVIAADGYSFIKPANGMEGIAPYLKEESFRAGAVAELERNIRLTGSARAGVWLGFVANETGRPAQAVEALARALAAKPPDDLRARALALQAFAFRSLGRTAEAVEADLRSIEARQSPATWRDLGLLYLDRGETGRGVETLEKAVKGDPGLLDAYPSLAEGYRRMGREAEARKAEDRLDKARRKAESARHFNLGLKAAIEGRYPEAVEEYGRALDGDPGNAVILSNLGYAWYDAGRPDMAFEYQKRAVAADARYANAHYGLALLYKARGMKDEAAREWREYLRLEPQGHYAREARQELSGR